MSGGGEVWQDPEHSTVASLCELMFEVLCDDIWMARVALEDALRLRLTERESDFWGGEYYRHDGLIRQVLLLTNEDCEGETIVEVPLGKLALVISCARSEVDGMRVALWRSKVEVREVGAKM
jgi:hypothetical protein